MRQATGPPAARPTELTTAVRAGLRRALTVAWFLAPPRLSGRLDPFLADPDRG